MYLQWPEETILSTVGHCLKYWIRPASLINENSWISLMATVHQSDVSWCTKTSNIMSRGQFRGEPCNSDEALTRWCYPHPTIWPPSLLISTLPTGDVVEWESNKQAYNTNKWIQHVEDVHIFWCKEHYSSQKKRKIIVLYKYLKKKEKEKIYNLW